MYTKIIKAVALTGLRCLILNLFHYNYLYLRHVTDGLEIGKRSWKRRNVSRTEHKVLLKFCLIWGKALREGQANKRSSRFELFTGWFVITTRCTRQLLLSIGVHYISWKREPRFWWNGSIRMTAHWIVISARHVAYIRRIYIYIRLGGRGVRYFVKRRPRCEQSFFLPLLMRALPGRWCTTYSIFVRDGNFIGSCEPCFACLTTY